MSEGRPPDPSPLERTADLLSLVRDGDEAARRRLLERFLPHLTRWAHGRLPVGARSVAETQDLIQDTLLRALQNLGEFRSTREGAFFGYLRSIALNAVRDELRRLARRPSAGPVPEELPSPGQSPLELSLGRQKLEAYEAALASLPALHQEAIILRLEFDLSYEEIAEALGKPSANAARMMVTRALVQLSEALSGPA